MVVGSFGQHLIFEVSKSKVLTPTRVKRDMAAAYEEHKLLGAKPRLEFLHPELNTCSFPVLLSAALGADPEQTMMDIEVLVAGGFVEKLILGGANYGRHVLLKASEDWVRSDRSGKPIIMQVTLEFKEYAA